MKKNLLFLFALLLIQGNSLWAQCPGTGSISFERWNNVTGTSVQSLATATNNYQNAPSSMGTWTSFNAPVNAGDNYGLRVRGYICAPQTGTYYFWILGDNEANLIVSNSSAVSTNVVASIPVGGFCNAGQWSKYPSQKSAAINLVAGQQYYIEAILKEGTGPDRLSVGWAKPGQSTTAPSQIIPGTNLIPMPSTPICGCGNPLTASFNVSNVVQSGTRISFGLSSCNASNITIIARQGTSVVAQVTKNITSAADLFIDLPANATTGAYTLQVVGVNCQGTSNQATFQYTAPLPVCGCGTSSPLSILSVTNTTGTMYNVSFNACNLTNANWRVKNSSNTVVSQGNVSPTSSTLSLNFGSLANGTYTFELEGTACSGMASYNFTVNNLPVCGCGTSSPLTLQSINPSNGTFYDVVFNACNVSNANWAVRNTNNIVVAQGNITPTSSTLHLDFGTLLAGTYTFELQGTSCSGSATLNFTVQGSSLPVCGCGNPVTANFNITNVSQVSVPTLSPQINFGLSSCNCSQATIIVTQNGNVIVQQTASFNSSSDLNILMPANAQSGTYQLQIIGIACQGTTNTVNFNYTAPGSLPSCSCNNNAFTINYATQVGTRVNFGLVNGCALGNMTVRALNAQGTITAQVTKSLTNPADWYIDMPNGAASGTYQLQIIGASCQGTITSAFTYTSTITPGTNANNMLFIMNTTGYGLEPSDPTGIHHDWRTRIDKFAQAGADAIRLTVNWRVWEQSPNVYSTQALTNAINYIKARGMKVAILFWPDYPMTDNNNNGAVIIPSADRQVYSDNTENPIIPSIFSDNATQKMSNAVAAMAQHLNQNFPNDVVYFQLALGNTEEYYIPAKQDWSNGGAYSAVGDYNPNHVLPKWRAYLAAKYGSTTPYSINGNNNTSTIGMLYPDNSFIPWSWQYTWGSPAGRDWMAFYTRYLISYYKTYMDAIKNVNPNFKVIYYVADFYGTQGKIWQIQSGSFAQAIDISDGIYHTEGGEDASVLLRDKIFPNEVIRGTWGNNKISGIEFDGHDLCHGPRVMGALDYNAFYTTCERFFQRGGNYVHFAMAWGDGTNGSPDEITPFTNTIALLKQNYVNNASFSPVNRNGLPSANIDVRATFNNGQYELRDIFNNLGGNSQPVNIVCVNYDFLYSQARMSNLEEQEEEVYTNALSLFPNPSTGRANLVCEVESTQDAKIEVLNSLGQVVKYWEQTLVKGKNEGTISLEAESKGIYVIRVHLASGIITEKLILE